MRVGILLFAVLLTVTPAMARVVGTAAPTIAIRTALATLPPTVPCNATATEESSAARSRRMHSHVSNRVPRLARGMVHVPATSSLILRDWKKENGNRIVTVNVSKLDEMPGLTPPKDAVVSYLISKAAEGHLPVYFAAIPLELVRPSSTEYGIVLGPGGVRARLVHI